MVVCSESDISPAIGSWFPVCVFVGSESDVSPAIGIRIPGLPVCMEFDVSPAIGSRFPVWFCLACVSRATSALILIWLEKIRMHRMRHPSEHVSLVPNYVDSDVCV